jgi:hypothetical protein
MAGVFMAGVFMAVTVYVTEGIRRLAHSGQHILFS